jgi:hypothetical protein
MMLVSACWFGGVWSDAEGDSADARRVASEQRCHDVVTRIWGADDKGHYEQLRAFEVNAIEDTANKVEAVAKADSVDSAHKDAIVKLLRAVADAKKEEMLARRAAERVKRDLDREPDKLSSDEAAAVAPLKASSALEALYKLDAGDLGADAQALGLMSALDRMDIARGLPKHLKVYAVSGAFALVFGVKQPEVPEDATKHIKPGTWLAYLTDTAKAAGHPVPDSAKTPKDREPLAYSGVLEGFSDKLKASADKVSDTTPLKPVVTRVWRRLGAEYEAEQAALASKQASPAPTPKGAPPKKK